MKNKNKIIVSGKGRKLTKDGYKDGFYNLSLFVRLRSIKTTVGRTRQIVESFDEVNPKGNPVKYLFENASYTETQDS